MSGKLLIIASRIPDSQKTRRDNRFFLFLEALSKSFETHFLSVQYSDEDKTSNKLLKELGVKLISLRNIQNKTWEKRIEELLKEQKYSVVVFNTYLTAKYYLPYITSYSKESVIVIDTARSQWLSNLKIAGIQRNEYLKKYELMAAKSIKMIELPIYNRADIILAENEDAREKLSLDIPNVPIIVMGTLSGDDVQGAANLSATGGFCEFKKKILRSDNVIDVIVISNKANPGLYKDILEKSRVVIAAAHGQNNTLLIAKDDEESYVRSYNRAIKAITAEYGLIMTSDTLLTEGAIEEMSFCASAHPHNVIIVPSSNVYLDNKMTEENLEGFLPKHKLANYSNWNSTRQIYGKCFLVKKALKEKIGLLDEKFSTVVYAWYDYCLRASQLDLNVILDNEAFVYIQDKFKFADMDFESDHRLLLDKWGESGVAFLEKIDHKAKNE